MNESQRGSARLAESDKKSRAWRGGGWLQSGLRGLRHHGTRTLWWMFAALLVMTTVAEAQTIRRVSAPGKFYVDDKSSAGIVYNYAIYAISNDTVSTLTGVLGDLGDCRCGRGEAEFVATNGQTTILDGIRSVELGGPYRNPFLSIWIKVSYIAGGTEPRVAFLCDGRWWGWRALLTCSGEDLANALAAIPLRSQRADHTSR